MSKRVLSGIIKQWRTPVKLKKDRPSRSELLKVIEQSPNSLEAKIAVNPYAKILASPLRKCTYHNRFFPSQLLLRFGQGWHEPTKQLWAYPTFKKSSGKGVYVNLSRKVLQIFGKGGYKAGFRGQIAYRTDMLDHVENMLSKESLERFSKLPINTYHILDASSTPSTWSTNESSPMGYQCILLFDPTNSEIFTTSCVNQQIKVGNTVTFDNIPCYSMHRLWPKEIIESIQKQLPKQKDTPLALGVPKYLHTVDLAIALWRQRKYLSS